ncbi:MAG: LysM peptidoglycan-binding domain-containing protein [Bacteroidales bacterium]
MTRHLLLGLLLFCFSPLTYAQADSTVLGESSRAFFTGKLDSMETLWLFQQNPAPEQKTLSLPNNPETIATNALKELEQDIPLHYSKLMWDIVRFYISEKPIQTERLLGLSKNLFPEIEKHLEEKGIPGQLKFLPMVSSALNPHARSANGRTGPWQLAYSTGKLYELTIDSYIDERRKLLLSTSAAAKMLQDLYAIYQDWRLAITAYNCSPSILNRAIRRAGTHTDYNTIYNHLPSPQRDLYPAFVAMVYIANHARELKLQPASLKWPPETDTVTVHKKLHLGQVAEVLQQDIHLLKDLNPSYRREIIPASYQSFSLTIPKHIKDSFLLLKDSIHLHRDTFFFQLKPDTDIVTEKTNARSKSKSPSGNHTAIYYTIKSGDNLGYISQWFDVSIRDLRYWNNIYGNRIRTGQRLLIYVPNDKAGYYGEFDKLSKAEKQRRIGESAEKAEKESKSEKPLKPGEYIMYTVQAGDNPWTIAQQYPGVSDQDILRWNNISPNDLKPGQKLKIKKQ